VQPAAERSRRMTRPTAIILYFMRLSPVHFYTPKAIPPRRRRSLPGLPRRINNLHKNDTFDSLFFQVFSMLSSRKSSDSALPFGIIHNLFTISLFSLLIL